MKKILMLGSALYVLASLPANAQYTQLTFSSAPPPVVVYDEYPHGADWNRRHDQYRYWHQRQGGNWDHERQEAWRNDHDNGHHYGKNHPKYKGHDKDRDDRHDRDDDRGNHNR